MQLVSWLKSFTKALSMPSPLPDLLLLGHLPSPNQSNQLVSDTKKRLITSSVANDPTARALWIIVPLTCGDVHGGTLLDERTQCDQLLKLLSGNPFRQSSYSLNI